MSGSGLALLVVSTLCASASALAGEALDPGQIALGYARSQDEARLRLALWQPGLAPSCRLDLRPPSRLARDLRRLAAPPSAPRDGPPTYPAAVTFDADTGLGAALSNLRSKMLFDLGTYDEVDEESGFENRSQHWAGINAEPRGRTLKLANGEVLGDLRISLGAAEARAGVGQVLAGEAGILDLNPFRDVTAVFDLAFLSLPRGLRKRLPPPLLILRFSATYLNAFSRAQAGSQGTGGFDIDSEGGLAWGVSW